MSVRELTLKRYMPAILTSAAALAFAMLPAAAYAYPGWTESAAENPVQGATCAQCHSTTSTENDLSTWDGSGPHGNYLATTKKCEVCHDVHAAPATSVLLLRGATVSQTCQMCHDGTGGVGAYGAIPDAEVVGEHSIEVSNVIPGGSSLLSGALSCADCHSVHGSNTVTPFLRDSGRAPMGEYDAYVVSDCLLRNDVKTGVVGSITEYGAGWCASCHDERHSGAALVNNHPVASDATWVYRTIPSTVTLASFRVEDLPGQAVGMGRTNGGYTMAPVAEVGDGHVVETTPRNAPICQQCHEDARQVEAVFDGDYTGRGTLPWEAGTNVPYLTFPHQTTNANLLVEEWDDLCLNCHAVSELP